MRRPKTFQPSCSRSGLNRWLEKTNSTSYVLAQEVGPVALLLDAEQALCFDGRVADHRQQRLMAPDIAFERSDIEIADDHGRRCESQAWIFHAAKRKRRRKN